MPKIRDLNPDADDILSLFAKELCDKRLIQARNIVPPKGWVYVGTFTPHK